MPVALGVRTRVTCALLAAGFGAVTTTLALQRYATFHNRTFDLALYARQAWGLAHGDLWGPIIGAPFVSTHLSFVLAPLGLFGRAFGVVPTLLLSQSLAVALATFPLARIGARRFGARGALAAAVAWLCYPNLGHVTTYEFHPGTLGVLPLALALDALDRGSARGLVLSCVALCACRADYASLALVLGALAFPTHRRAGALLAAGAAAYLALHLGVLQHLHTVPRTSLDLHFGKWGGSPLGVVTALFTAPARVYDHFAAPARLLYVPLLCAPLAFLPLTAPRYFLLLAPQLALNLASEFPTTTRLDSHYLTSLTPTLVVAALDGLHALGRRGGHRGERHAKRHGLAFLCAASVLSLLYAGGTPGSRAFDAGAFTPDATTADAKDILSHIPKTASVQAPDALLPHLAERARVFRGPPPDRGARYVVLDTGHRVRFAHREDLLRTTEEPLTRRWLARQDFGVARAGASLLLLRRGLSPRAGAGQRYLREDAPLAVGTRLTDCLRIVDARLSASMLQLLFYAEGGCPSDLAVRIGGDPKPSHVDLLFDGVLSPVHLRRGDLAVSLHLLAEAEQQKIRDFGVRVGALRSSGAPPAPQDPISVPLPIDAP